MSELCRVSTKPDGVVDVIVPVYKGYEETRRCVESVLQADSATPFELVLINDASPDPRLVDYCDSLRDSLDVTLLVNSENLGFVETVNRGILLHPERDVVLLNSDTEVPNNWLDRMWRCVYSQKDIGTSTPFSNNATICSYPDFCADNAIPAAFLAELDAVFAQVNAGKLIDLPTAVGFCMFIRRACLEDVGLFDASQFGRGYGEENDFSRRAARAGWRNVLCADVFVYHAGGVSFQTERKSLMAAASDRLDSLHPDYAELVRQFVFDDPPAKFRQAVDIELARQRMNLSPMALGGGKNLKKPVQLHVVHDLGGGIERWCRDFCMADQSRINLVLKPYSQSHAMGEGLMLFCGADYSSKPLGFWRFAEHIMATIDSHSEYQQVLESILRDYAVDAIVVSSLIGHSLDVLDTDLPTILIQHDFYPWCSAIHGYFQEVCQSCDDERLARCAEHNSDFHPAHSYFCVEHRRQVRERYVDLIVSRNLTVVAPCSAAREHFNRLLPQIEQSRFVTIPHGHFADILPIEPSTKGNDSGKLRVVILGMLSVSKGLHLLSDGLERLLEFVELHLVGTKELGELFKGRPGVQVIDSYSVADLPGILAEIQPDVGLLLSAVPETFSYTLSELYMLGIPPVATRLGSFSERILQRETGYLFEPDANAMLECLRDIHLDRKTLQRIRTRVLTIRMRSAYEMVSDYHLLLALPNGNDVPAWLNRWQLVGQSEAESVDQMRMLSARWKEAQSLRLTLHARLLRMQACEREVRDLRGRLEDHYQQTSEGLALRDQLIATIYASTSWRISSPVRWFGRHFRETVSIAGSLRRFLLRPSRMALRVRILLSVARDEGAGGVKRILLQRSVSKRPEPLDSVASDMPLIEEAWGNEPAQIFSRYRASYAANARTRILDRIKAMESPPLISVLVPTYNTNATMLREMLDSVCGQFYPNWQLCIADDCSRVPLVRQVLNDYANRDSRIRLDFASTNGGVSHATNRALAMADGKFVVLLDHDDMLEEQALFRVAEAVMADDPDMLYSDEVLVGEDGKTVQHLVFRPTFSPEYLRSHPYIVHLIGFRLSFLRQLGGLDETLRISQDYDLILRASEQAHKILHIPEVLYRWRIHQGSAGHLMIGQVMDTSREILLRHLRRCGVRGDVHEGESFNFFSVRYPLANSLKVAIIIPTKNHAALVRSCIESIKRTVVGIAYEIILVDHESDDPATQDYFDSIRSMVTLLRYSGPFNFSKINNWAVAQLDGSFSHYLFCNNDIEAVELGWLERMMELGQTSDVGIVGAKLYYPDRKTIQHSGVVVACCGVAENLGRSRITGQSDLGYIGSLICNREVSAVTAACMLVQSQVFQAVGGFDEDFAVGYGDVDLCLRVGDLGYRVLFCPHANLLHHESFTRGRSQEDPHPEDSSRFVERWRAFFETGDPYYNPNLSSLQPDWQVANPLEFELDIHRRAIKKTIGNHAM